MQLFRIFALKMSTITPTYNPHIPQTRTRCPHTYGVRVCLCVTPTTEPCRPTACIPLAHPPAVPCPLTPVRWTFTFSAKEKDSETGFSYFGSRYYSSDLSIWLSIDPQASKYPSLSPYVYCANNPVKLVDPNGETVVIPNEDDQVFIENLVNPDSKEYSKEFHDIYKKLQQSSTTYTFESWSYDASRREDGLFDRGNENNNPSIHFTKDDNPQIQDRTIGASRYRVLFEETYHAYQYEKRGKAVNSCISEAAAWKFSTLAPGTKKTYFDDKSGEWTTTLMGRIHDSSIPSIALGFKFGMPATSTATGIQGPGLYSDFKLGSAQELKVFFPYFNF